MKKLLNKLIDIFKEIIDFFKFLIDGPRDNVEINGKVKKYDE